MKAQNAIVTFDYEVFLGRKTGSVENCVLRPVELILETLCFHKAKAIFFVDAAWLLFIKGNSDLDFRRVSSQIRDIIACGSSVELHLHPQWLDAYIENGEMLFSTFDRYRLHALPRRDIGNLFRDSVDLLESISCRKVRCFRAGGWCIEPFHVLADSFAELGIKYDFSVVPGTSRSDGRIWDYDFSKSPRLPFYKFDSDINIPNKCGPFVEVPMVTYPTNIVYKCMNKALQNIVGDRIFGDGVGIKEMSLSKLLLQAIRGSRAMLSIDQTNSLMFRYLLAAHLRNVDPLVIVSHPKTGSSQALKNLAYIAKNFRTLCADDLDSILDIV